ncbi:MAG: glycosyltransferase [Coriobacteriia bacterium]
MRVTMVNKYYPPHIGGIEHHMRDLATALVAHGHGVRAIVANEGPETLVETLDGVEVRRLGRLFAYASTPVALSMPSVIRAEASAPDAPDLLHLHFPYPWGEVAWLRAVDALERRGLPTVMTYHSDIVRQKALLALYEPLLRRVLDRVDLVMASSPNLIEHSPYLSRIAEKCRVCPFGIPAERYESTPELEARAAELRAGHERPIVLFVGRLIYYKGAEVLVRAMAEVDADLVMIGRGPLKAELEALAVSLSIANRVRFVDPVGDAELAAWYRAAAVFCLPSVARSEAFGLVQLEAHASGTPVVATNLTTGVPFVNQHEVTGLNVEPGDPAALADTLRTLVADEPLRERLGRQAYERVHAEFTTARMVERVLRVYHEARGVA